MMGKIMSNRYVILLSRFILGIIFIYASIDKIIDPVSFSSTIDNYHISPYSLNNIAALVIPWLELIIGVFLICGIFINGSSFIAILLLLFFIFILTQALLRGINVDCGCFDLNADTLEDSQLRIKMIRRILEDILFLVLAFIINKGSR
tara:strand:- start:130 stop:573 length:444 start_codon:yes stop_codon:yes gene_type:complete